MKSAWSSVSQKEYECFLGLRERDYEFEKKAEELTLAQQDLDRIQVVLLSFAQQTQGLPVLFEDIINNIIQAYPDDNCFSDFIKNVVRAHKELQTAYFNCKDSMATIENETQQWKVIYSQAAKDIVDRNEKLRVYEHYDIKMEELIRERNERFSKKKTESDKEIGKYSRNYDKYIKATNEYIESSNKAYLVIHNLLESKYSLISQSVVNFILFEKKFYDRASQILSYYNNAKQMLYDYNRKYIKKAIDYDSAKYVRGRMMSGVISINIKTVQNQDARNVYHKAYSDKDISGGGYMSQMNCINYNTPQNNQKEMMTVQTAQGQFSGSCNYQQPLTKPPSVIQPVAQSKYTPDSSQLKSQMSGSNPYPSQHPNPSQSQNPNQHPNLSQYQNPSQHPNLTQYQNPSQHPNLTQYQNPSQYQKQQPQMSQMKNQSQSLKANSTQNINPYHQSSMGSNNQNPSVNPYQQSQVNQQSNIHSQNLSHSNQGNSNSTQPKGSSSSVNNSSKPGS